jgi:CRP/FNR family transcriptional regulator, nitrogen oxide reductase regulator
MKCDCKLTAGKHVVGLPTGLHPRLFAGLSKSELNAVLTAATHRHFPASAVVLREQDPAERVMLLASGQGRHFVLTRNGRKILLRMLTPGQIFGGMAALAERSHYLLSTEILTGSCALVWERAAMRSFVMRYPKLLDNGLSIAVTEHLAWLLSALVSLTTDDAAGRIAHTLVSLACGIGKPGPNGVEIRVGNDDLASGANVTPFTVSRVLNDWQRDGILTKGRGRVVLHKPELLATP